MKKNNNSFIKGFNITCFIAMILCILFSAFVFFTLILNDQKTATSASVGQGTYFPEETYLISINNFTNENNNGIPLTEFNFTGYTSWSTPEEGANKAGFSSGLQWENGAEFVTDNDVWANPFRPVSYVTPQHAVYYNQDQNGITYAATNKLDWKDSFVFDIEGEFILVESAGDKEQKSVLWGVWSQTVRHDFNYFMSVMAETINTLPLGSTTVTFELSDFLKLSVWNGEKFDPITDRDINKVFITVAVHNYADGAMSANQSLFGMIRGTTSWNFSNIEGKDYASVLGGVSINEQFFDYAVSPAGGEFARLAKVNTSLIEYLGAFETQTLPRISIDLSSNFLTSNGIMFYGLNHNFLNGIEVKEIHITAATPTVLYLYVDSVDTSLLRLSNVTIQLLGGA